MSRGASVLAVATASPPHVLAQAQLRAFARRFFARDFPAIDRLLPAFDNSGIAERQMASPIEWFDEPHSFAEKNEVYRRCALDMSARAGAEALRRSGVKADEIAAIVFVSTTGIATPSLDSYLVQLLGLSRAAARVPIWGLGCAGGAAGLARAADLVRALGRPVLLIAAEVCSATFVHGDRSKSNLIATALFGDGAAAVVLAPGDEGLQIVGSHSHLIDDSEDIMGWTLEPQGLRVRFARSIPNLVRDTVPGFKLAALRAAHVSPEEVEHYVLHPGGTKVLAAYEAALSVSRARIEGAYTVLREHGNMSSPTLLFVLERFMRETPRSGAAGLALGLGPGFAAEAVMFRW
jgi:alkylresorcinol/alkylpyrone synthase